MASKCCPSGGVFHSAHVSLKAVDDPIVSGNFTVPSAVGGIVSERPDIGELSGNRREELGSGRVAGAGLADVGVGACLGDEVSRAVPVGDAGLEHFRPQPCLSFGDLGTAADRDGDPPGQLSDGLVVGSLDRWRRQPGVAQRHVRARMAE